MIVLWRLILAYYVCAVLFYNRRFFAWRDTKPALASFVQGAAFLCIAGGLCAPYLVLSWPFAALWEVPGYICVLAAALFYVFINHLFVYRPGQTHGHTLTFLAHDTLAILFLFLCAPLSGLARTGNWMAEPWTVCAVGLLIVTKMFSVFIYMVEQDLYGRDFPTIDESFVTILMRLIFFLLVLLPGWRWGVWFVVWLWACHVARRNRLMDLSRFAFYFSAFGASAVGFLVRWAWYWH